MIATFDTLVVIMIVLTMPAANLFPIVYGLTTRWWDTLAGQALMISSTSTMLLMDLALLVRVFDVNPLATAILRFLIMSLIFAGVSLMFFALMRGVWPRFQAWLCRTCGRSDDTPLA